MATLERFVANIVGKIHYADLGGKRYIVAPLTLIVPGVLHGSKGPLYYPPEEIARTTTIWNNAPIVVYHPTDDQGEPLSATADGVLDKQGIGLIRNPRFADKLTAEGWFDIERLKVVNKGRGILDSLEGGIPLELSTGLFTDNDDAPADSNYKGKPYTHIARNYRADHLAILPDQVGACSLNDGCGVLVNTMNDVTSIVDAAYAELVENGEQCDTAGMTPGEHERQAVYHEVSASKHRGKRDGLADYHDKQAEKHRELAQQKMSGLPTANAEAVEAAYNRNWPQAKRDKTDKADFAGPNESFPIVDQADVDAASHLVGKAADPEAVKSRIAEIAKRKGLKLPESWADKADNATHPGTTTPLLTTKNEAVMTQEELDNLIGNGGPGSGPHKSSTAAMKATSKSPWLGTHGHHATALEEANKAVAASKSGDHATAAHAHVDAEQAHLSAMTRVKDPSSIGHGGGKAFDAHVTAAKAHSEAAANHFAAYRATHNQEGGDTVKLTQEQRTAIVNSLCTNCACQTNNVWTDEDKPTLNAMADERLVRLAKQRETLTTNEGLVALTAKTLGIQPAELTVNAMPAALQAALDKKKGKGKGKGGDKPTPKDDDDDETVDNDGDEDEPNMNTKSRLTAEEQEDLAFARNEKNKQKQQIVNQLVANTAVENREHVAEMLKIKTLPELRDLLMLQPSPVANRQPTGQAVVNYQGAAGSYGPSLNLTQNQDNDAGPLIPPTINYGAWIAEDCKHRKAV